LLAISVIGRTERRNNTGVVAAYLLARFSLVMETTPCRKQLNGQVTGRFGITVALLNS